MPGEILTNEREEAYAEQSPTRNMPDVTTFKAIVARHLLRWGVQTVDQLCSDQTKELIAELAQHFS